MDTNPALDTVSTNSGVSLEQNMFIEKLYKHLNKEVQFKIEQDDVPIKYTLKEIGKDYITVHFSEMERVIPIKRILFFQAEVHPPSVTKHKT